MQLCEIGGEKQLRCESIIRSDNILGSRSKFLFSSFPRNDALQSTTTTFNPSLLGHNYTSTLTERLCLMLVFSRHRDKQIILPNVDFALILHYWTANHSLPFLPLHCGSAGRIHHACAPRASGNYYRPTNHLRHICQPVCVVAVQSRRAQDMAVDISGTHG